MTRVISIARNDRENRVYIRDSIGRVGVHVLRSRESKHRLSRVENEWKTRRCGSASVPQSGESAA